MFLYCVLASKYRKEAVPEVSAESTSIPLLSLLVANSLHTGSSHNSTLEHSRGALNALSGVLAMPFQLVASPLVSFDNKGRGKVGGRAGEGRWGASCCPGAAVLSRRAAVSKCHTASPAFASRVLGVLSKSDFFTCQV